MFWGLDELGDELRQIHHALNQLLGFPAPDHNHFDLHVISQAATECSTGAGHFMLPALPPASPSAAAH